MSDNKEYIKIQGAKVHNLKNISIDIPREKLVVITGLSGSGKSSLAFDTLYAEGQRRYVESLSSYARQFLGRMNKPEVDFINGIPPAIAIEQRVNTRNPRSTVGTSTEIYDYLRLLYARAGITYSPDTGREVKKHSPDDVADFMQTFPEGISCTLLAPIHIPENIDLKDYLEFLTKQGVNRIRLDREYKRVKDISSAELESVSDFHLVIDRMPVQYDQDSLSRMTESVQTAFQTGNGQCLLVMGLEEPQEFVFSNRFEEAGQTFEEPNEHFFSFNNPLGACPVCEGYGRIVGIDEELVIPDKNRSVYQDAIVCWKGEKMSKWKDRLIRNAAKFDFPIHTPYYKLTDEQKNLLWTGNRYFFGLHRFFDYLEEKKYKVQYRVMLSRYRGKTICPECKGNRLRKDTSFVKVGGKSIQELINLPADRLLAFFEKIELTANQKKIAARLLPEITVRLQFLCNVGLSYLSLNRLSSTLSGGESQRINLATSLGSSLVGSLYILDEPSIGLHPRDTHLLIEVLRNLQEIGNTVLVVEHEEEIIRAADHLIDIGPLAGQHGGEILFAGPIKELQSRRTDSLTAAYLYGEKKIDVPGNRRKWNSYIEIKGARQHNLKEIDVQFPLHTLTVVTGVSGSGKSTLVNSILYPALMRQIDGSGAKPGPFHSLEGDVSAITGVEMVDQNPIGKSSRSNPVTYLKAWDEIRKLFAEQQAARINNYKPAHFSFNVEGGRCEECQGEGIIKVEMQFMADVELECDQCHGQRFKKEILEVKYRDKSVFEVLQMTVNQAISFFAQSKGKSEKRIIRKLQPLADVGLGYITLGQSSSTLSGGESQRVKLASFLSQEKTDEHLLFIFDEPTTGLHFHDIHTLLKSINALIDRGHSVLIIEHNMEVIKQADWVIDLGPEGGEKGGYLVAAGRPEEIAGNKKSATGRFLRKKL